MSLNNYFPRVAIDIDDTLVDFLGEYQKLFPGEMISKVITKNVRKLQKNKDFWENLPLLERPNFDITIYATKRINSKDYTRNCLLKLGLPIRPIYQQYCQLSNKADIIKGRCDVLIDDSYFNVREAIRSGLPAILIDRPHNRHIDFKYRIFKLDKDEVQAMYYSEIRDGIKRN